MTQSQLAVQVPVEVLAPQIDLTDVLAKTAAIEELFKTAFIPTDRASQYFRWLDELRLLKQCGRVIGPRNVGKSRSSSQYREEDRKRVLALRHGQIQVLNGWFHKFSKTLIMQLRGENGRIYAPG
jgi:hypothetical protein